MAQISMNGSNPKQIKLRIESYSSDVQSIKYTALIFVHTSSMYICVYAYVHMLPLSILQFACEEKKEATTQ